MEVKTVVVMNDIRTVLAVGRTGIVVDDAETLSIQLVKLQQFLHLAVIGTGIRVYHLTRRTSVIHIIAKVIKKL